MQQREEVFKKLALVNDPELDRSLTELEFINEVTIQDSSVTVSFRLPTYWCSTNFAFIMAEDIRDRVSELPWVSNVVVRLEDHCAAAEINEGVSSRKSFFETFPNMAKGELQELRESFRIKAYFSRQEKLIQYLIRSGLEHAAILNLTIQGLSELPFFEAEGTVLAERYLAIREEFGQGNQPEQTAFIRPDGSELDPESFPDYLASARLIRLSMEFNGHHCQGLFQTRYGTEPLSEMEACKNESSAFV
ncbi:iron-sulfur cluster assembly protein [Paenibacillus hamazuiensis]|uniref:iron-sulfur cluster assembly protein n=1 Tax=Paenibacillus hamazuiensis TaxID=2936508 RepID=UPI00200CDFB8|nr:iron-sulfur cluster assembly protein [Paenibacillus hamazuiensis]